MPNTVLEGNHWFRSHHGWQFTSFTIICSVTTFVLGWYLLRGFVYELLQSRDKDKLYGEIMQAGLIVCIFNISKFYLLLCFRKKSEIVDLVDSETGGNSTKENEVKDAYDRDDHICDDKCLVMEGQHIQTQELQKVQGAREKADINMDAEQNQEQNFSKIKDGQNLQDDLVGANRQDNDQMRGQINRNNEGSEERVLAADDMQVHMHKSENENIQHGRKTTDGQMNGRCRSQSMDEEHHSRRQDDQNIKGCKFLRSSRSTGDPGSSSNSEIAPSPYGLRHRSCFP